MAKLQYRVGKSPGWTLLLPGRNDRPVVSAERRGRQACAVREIAVRVIQPGIAHGDWREHIRAADDDCRAIHLGGGGLPLLICSGDLEALQGAAVLSL